MANRHFGNIGDIWKHLPLAEILAIEKPQRYWESHAGSAEYPLRHSRARDYGIYYLLAHASDSLDVGGSSFVCLLEGARTAEEPLTVYPGSPGIAMEMVGSGAWYFFCDIDGASLKIIRQKARSLGLPAGRLRCAKADGVATLLKSAVRLPQEQASSTLALIDPCAGDEPFVKRDGRPSPMDLFSLLAALGAKAILWYSFDSLAERQAAWEAMRASLGEHGVGPGAKGLWCGEICLRAIGDACRDFNPGVMGCGILCSNLSEEAVSASSRLGHELSRVYSGASFPGGRSGAFDFRNIRLDMAAGGQV
jgi:23S rRNA (adenine2030-N6)-methyltransferase